MPVGCMHAAEACGRMSVGCMHAAEACGRMSVGCTHAAEACCTMNASHVAPDYRRQRLANKLMDSLEQVTEKVMRLPLYVLYGCEKETRAPQVQQVLGVLPPHLGGMVCVCQTCLVVFLIGSETSAFCDVKMLWVEGITVPTHGKLINRNKCEGEQVLLEVQRCFRWSLWDSTQLV
eukprot:1158278-Pelagomonas_calceolata.AAC.5